MKARTVGPCLLILIGVLALFAPGTGSVGAGVVNPCDNQVGFIQCPPRTTTTTTTLPAPTVPLTTTTESTTTTTEVTTTVPDTSVPETELPPPSVPVTDAATTTTVEVAAVVVTSPPAASGGTLARTGSDGIAPTSLAGIALILLGGGLLVLGRRRTRTSS